MQNYSPYFEPELETMSRDQLEALQLERLQKTVRHCMNSGFYRNRFKEMGITPDDIRTLDDVRKLPFTTKDDLREYYPFGLASVPMRDCVRLHSSSGTTGNPTVVLHTQKDLDEWAKAVARCLWMVGSRPEDVFQNSAGYGMFTAGLGFQYGAERVGMLTVPAAAGNTKRQIKFIRDFGTTVLHAIPSYASRVFEVMREEGVDPRRDTKLRVLCIGAEPHSEEQRQRIEEQLGVKAYNSYGISEMMGPGVAFECPEQNGLHIWEDYFIVEIIDPVTLEPVPDGQLGELVLTTINREGMPLLRYRTRDLTRILPGECACGRHHKRLARLQGRSDDMMILKGVNIFPIQIEKILLGFKELGTDYLITLETLESGDAMTVDVELARLETDDYTQLQALTKEITRQLKDEILITPKVRLVQKGSLGASDEKKAVRVRDLRKLF
jgi:phenylacetate-CoA ligase